MDLVLYESIKGRSILSPVPLQLPFLPPPPPPPIVNFENKITPSILLIIVVLAVIFFVSGLLHLLVRYLLRPNDREPDAISNVTVFQGQLQQLFHLHDAGVDQSFIDSLPVFHYKSIIGLKDPFDCAVCLCEFEADDKLRLLPKCSHAFHFECIDTWLLSHSTCPLCRRCLLLDFSPNDGCRPGVLVLESSSESSKEIASDANIGLPGDDGLRSLINDTSQKPAEIAAVEEVEVAEAKVVPVKLGKFRRLDVGGGQCQGTTSGNSGLDQRRCFSMGSHEYVMDDRSLLRVAIRPTKKKPALKKPIHRVAMSECDCHSKRDGFSGFDASRRMELRGDDGNASMSANLHKKESFSVSKIWLRSRTDEPIAQDASRRAFSFRLPLRMADRDERKLKKSSEMDLETDAGSCNNSVVSRADETPSFARRTLLWIVGRQNRIGDHL
ncbi:RING-H2 finger protein [Musa troglodytarum]|uniref:RING-type E3 ubiquitin transferase n=1 Tax=Musa troglodytarum TaxID=320322 RepID=A0A9E7KGB3_9LILI|nr:RING-H2 finger protein [Musa troglodytarum]